MQFQLLIEGKCIERSNREITLEPENDIRIVSGGQPEKTSVQAAENQDWANLGYYKEQNKLLGISSNIERKIVFIGDSITEEWNNLYPEFFSRKNFINRGIGGQTTPQILVRFKPDAIDLRPDVIIILAGTNDIAGNTGPATVKMITDNIFSMAELAMINNIRVVISSILPVYEYPWNDNVMDPPKTIASINGIIKEYIQEHDLLYLDYYSSMVDEHKGLRKEYTNDGVHPNEAGYRLMCVIAESIISQALGRKESSY